MNRVHRLAVSERVAGRCPQRLHQLGLEAITLGARHDQCSVGAPCPSGSLSFFETGVAPLIMAATAPPNARTGGPAPTTVTVIGTVPAKDLAISFLATDSYVTNYPTSMFTLSAAAAGGAPPTASVPMELAIRTWGEPLTFRYPDARNHAPTGDAFTFALTGAAFSRILTELAASGLLDAYSDTTVATDT